MGRGGGGGGGRKREGRGTGGIRNHREATFSHSFNGDFWQLSFLIKFWLGSSLARG